MNASPCPPRLWSRKMVPAILLVGILCLIGSVAADLENSTSRSSRRSQESLPTPANRDLPAIHAEKPDLKQAASRIQVRPPHARGNADPAWHRALKPRKIHPKTAPVSQPGQAHRLLVKFADPLEARANRDGTLDVSLDDPALRSLAETLQLRFRTLQTASEDSLAALRKRAALRSGTQQPDPASLVEVLAADSKPATVLAAAEALTPLAAVEYLEIESEDAPPPPPSEDAIPSTPSLDSYQTYRQPVLGIGVETVWETYGVRGDPGLRITDCEYQFNPLHEDLSGAVSLQPGVVSMYTAFGDDHGTAVLGVLAAGENGFGMTGAVQGTPVHFYPERAMLEDGYTQFRAATITAAIAASAPGDIVVLEMQSSGPGGAYGPAEYSSSTWNAVKTGTDAGVIVIAAAGNGGQDMDSPAWGFYESRGHSGAILVGAGTPERERISSESWSSTYGSRVDLQGWGSGVATTGYGTLMTFGDDPNQKYTSSFSGTSSATSLVASAAALVQSAAIQKLGVRLSPEEMRTLLVTTGHPQTGDKSKKIGPLPDLTAAIPQLLARKFSNTNGIHIPGIGEALPYPSSIAVSGVEGVVSSVRVEIHRLSHTEPRDLDVLLVSPNGRVAALMSEAGGSFKLEDTMLMFDDTASTLLPVTSDIVSGRHRPTDHGQVPEIPPPGAIGPVGTELTPLAADGANGEWKLYISDNYEDDPGDIDSWSISFETTPFPTVELTAEAEETSETGTPVAITATLSEPTTVEVSVPFTVSGSASDPADFSLPAGPILIPAGQTSGSISIAPARDGIIEDDESIIIAMESPVNAVPAPTAGPLTITLHDANVVLTLFSNPADPQAEGESQVFTIGDEVTVTVDGPYEHGATRQICSGWTGTGSAPETGASCAASFLIWENSSITWNWGVEFRLEVLTQGSGDVEGETGWLAEGRETTLAATPAPGYYFSGWDIPESAIPEGDDPTAPQIIARMVEPITVVAHFLPVPTAREAYAAWAVSSGIIAPDDSGAAVPHGEGTPNLLKYAFNMDASGSGPQTLTPGTGTAGLPCLTQDFSTIPPVLRLEYLCRRESGLNYTALQLADPGAGPHTPMTGRMITEEISPLWLRITIEQEIDPLEPRRFFTVEVTLPDDPAQ